MTDLIDRISRDNLLRFALVDGWHRHAEMRGVLVLRRADDTAAEALVPLDDGFADFQEALRRAAVKVLDRASSRDRALAEMLPGFEPIHGWFELSYAQYLTIPRSALQSMPIEWQARFAACLEQLDDVIDWRPSKGRYWVYLKDGRGRYVRDPMADYERGRRRLPLRERGSRR